MLLFQLWPSTGEDNVICLMLKKLLQRYHKTKIYMLFCSRQYLLLQSGISPSSLSSLQSSLTWPLSPEERKIILGWLWPFFANRAKQLWYYYAKYMPKRKQEKETVSKGQGGSGMRIIQISQMIFLAMTKKNYHECCNEFSFTPLFTSWKVKPRFLYDLCCQVKL